MATFALEAPIVSADVAPSAMASAPIVLAQLFGIFVPPNNPTVVGQSPAPGTAVLPTTPITFQVANATGRYAIGVQYPSGLYELAWDGTVFTPFYLGGSGFIAAPAGSTGYSLLRTGGWLDAPTIVIVTGF